MNQTEPVDELAMEISSAGSSRHRSYPHREIPLPSQQAIPPRPRLS